MRMYYLCLNEGKWIHKVYIVEDNNKFGICEHCKNKAYSEGYLVKELSKKMDLYDIYDKDTVDNLKDLYKMNNLSNIELKKILLQRKFNSAEGEEFSKFLEKIKEVIK